MAGKEWRMSLESHGGAWPKTPLADPPPFSAMGKDREEEEEEKKGHYRFSSLQETEAEEEEEEEEEEEARRRYTHTHTSCKAILLLRPALYAEGRNSSHHDGRFKNVALNSLLRHKVPSVGKIGCCGNFYIFGVTT